MKPNPKSTPFKKFEQLIQRLARVSKDDLDEQAAKERKQATHSEAPGKDAEETRDDASGVG